MDSQQPRSIFYAAEPTVSLQVFPLVANSASCGVWHCHFYHHNMPLVYIGCDVLSIHPTNITFAVPPSRVTIAFSFRKKCIPTLEDSMIAENVLQNLIYFSQ